MAGSSPASDVLKALLVRLGGVLEGCEVAFARGTEMRVDVVDIGGGLLKADHGRGQGRDVILFDEDADRQALREALGASLDQ
jgi:hypothetical protein